MGENLEKHWERIQKKTFTGWINSHLRKVGEVVKDIETDLADGLKLIKLLEVISGEQPFKSYEKKPKLRVQKVINVGHCLKFVTSSGIKLVGIGAEDIVDGKLTLILGLIWTIILRFQIQDISEEELSAKEGLLLWVQKKTKPYDNVNVTNFHTSFQDGLAFCALIHAHRPELIPYDTLSKEDQRKNLQLAFDVAEEHLDIPQILDVEDIVSIPKPDERSIMTYVAAMYHVFASSGKAEASGKAIGDIVDLLNELEKLMGEYGQGAQNLVDWIKEATSRMEDRDFKNSLEGIQEDIDDFKKFRKGEKPPKGTEKNELEAKFNALQTKLRLNNRPAYVPPEGLSPEDINKLWDGLNKAENDRGIALREHLKKLKQLEYLFQKFKVKAEALDNWCSSKSNYLKTDDLGNSLSAVEAKLKNHETFEEDYKYQGQRLEQLQDLKNKIVEGGHSQAQWCEDRYSGIENTYSNELKETAAERKQKLEAERERWQKIQENLLKFAKNALEFARAVEDLEDALSDPIIVDTVEQVKGLQSELDDTIKQQYDQTESSYNDLVALAESLKSEGVAEDTYSEYSVDDVHSKWNNAKGKFDERKEKLSSEMESQQSNEELKQDFAKKAEAFHSWCQEKEKEINSGLSGDMEEQLEKAKELRAEVDGNKQALSDCQSLSDQLEERQVADNPHTKLTIETLNMNYEALQAFAANGIKVLEGEIMGKKHSGMDAEQIAELKEYFDHFDKNHDGSLERLELNSCLKAIGQDPTDAELDSILANHGRDGQDAEGNATKVLAFDDFVEYLKSKQSTENSPSSVINHFKVIAGDKDFVTEADLRAAGLSSDKIEYLTSKMEPKGDGYDYYAYANSLYQ